MFKLPSKIKTVGAVKMTEKQREFITGSQIKELLMKIGTLNMTTDDKGCKCTLTTNKEKYLYSVTVTHEQYKDYYFSTHKADFIFNEYKNEMIANHCVRKLYEMIKN